MRRGLLAAIFLFAAAVAVHAQVQISAQTTRSIFLLYERIDVIVTLTNIGNTDLELNNDEGRPWLGFMVMGESIEHNFMPVHSERQSNFAPMTLKAGETKTLRVNITPLYTIRAEGNYRVSSVIDLPGEGQVVSDPVAFSVQRGHTVVSTVRVVDTLERNYSLIRFSPSPQDTSLYLNVEEPSENTVYANFALGPIVSSVDPTMLFDPQGNVHVLQPMALGTYLYTRTNPDGKVLAQRIFKTANQIRPQLIKIDDGSVFVSGGISEDPNAPRERLSDTQRGEKIMAPTSADQQVQQQDQQTYHGAQPADTDPSPAPMGDPGAAASKAAPVPANNPSSTDMPPAGP